MGVMNEADAAKHTEKMKGLGSNPNCSAAEIAMGVIIIAVAALERGVIAWRPRAFTM